MTTFAAIRLSDGLLASLTDVPNMPSNLVDRAIASYGGAPNEWESIALSDSEVAQLLDQQDGDQILLNGGVITIIKGFPLALREKQLNSFQRGFIINKKVTDLRKRTVTRKEV